MAGGYDNIGICRNQLGSLALLRVLAGYTAVDDEIAPLDPAEPPHRLVERTAREPLPGDDETDMGSLRRLLRTGSPSGGRSCRAEQ